MSNNQELLGRLVAAEARLAVAEAKIVTLQNIVAPPITKAAVYVEPKTVVRTPGVAIAANMPNADELRQIREAVFQRFPQLRPKPDPRDPFDSDEQLQREKGFASEFAFVAGLKRTSELNNKFDRSWWTDHVEDHRKLLGLSGICDAHGVLCSAIAQNVLFTLDNWPYGLALGLDPRSSGNKLDPSVWRAVLADGVSNTPKTLERRREYTQSQTIDLLAPRWS